MSHRFPSSPSPDAAWWPWSGVADDSAALSTTPRRHSPSMSARFAAASPPSTPAADSDSVVTVPARGGTDTPNAGSKTAEVSGWASSSEVRQRIGGASPETTRRVAMGLYESMRRLGLREEAERAIRGAAAAATAAAPEEVEEEEEEEVVVVGMEYLMKDGVVSYLRDVAKITPPIPQQVVRFCGITYSKKVETTMFSYETFGSKLLGCFLNPLKRLCSKNRSIQVEILKGIDGYVMPGSITLLLGPPGSGKSTLLEVLAGRVEPNKDSGVEGVVMYNDQTASEVRRSRLIAYVSGQLNKHIPFLSVRETLEFARDCTQGLRPENFTPQMRKFFAHALVEGQDPFLEYVLEILDLKRIEHNTVGDSISDTDRQRLTTAELALGTYSVMLYDQPLAGSDPATTYDLVDTIRTINRIQQSSAVMSLNHLSQEVFDLFDRIILLGEGQVLYQGPRHDAAAYFARLGFMKPSHVESWEFLEDIVAGQGMQYQLPGSTPMSSEELVECYYSSNHYEDIVRIIGTNGTTQTYWIESEPGIGLSLKKPTNLDSKVGPDQGREETELVVAKLLSKVGNAGGIESTGRIQVGDVVTGISMNGEELQYLAIGPTSNQTERVAQVYSTLGRARGHIRLQIERSDDESDHKPKWEQFQRPFVQTWRRSTRTLIHRQFRVAKRLQMLIKLRLFQACVLGAFAGTLFYKLGGENTQQKMNSIRALGFVTTMSIMLINLVQLPLYMLQRPIFYKHRAQRFFRTSSYLVAHSVVNIPQTFVEAFLYTVCVYFLAGLTVTNYGVVFFEYLLLMFLVAYFGSSVFLFLSAVSSIPEVGNALAGLIVSIFLLFSGFVIYPSNIPQYWKWLMYVNPIRWANLSFCYLQFSNGYKDPCTNYIDQLPFCKEYPNMTVGKAYLVFSQLSNDASGKSYVPYAVLVGWILIANLSALLALKKIEFSQTTQSLPHVKERKSRGNYLYDIESGESSFDDYIESSEYSGAPKNTRSHVRTARGDDEDWGVGDWVEEFRADVESEQLRIPVVPLTLTFSDLSFLRCDETTKQKFAVFDHVSGYAKPGTMLALLGGAKGGATVATLLKCLASRAPPNGELIGEIQVNGVDYASNTFSKAIGYVERLDAHQPYLSVRESLQFSAGLRLDKEISSMKRKVHAELVLHQLGLKYYANYLVGSLRDASGKTFEIAKKITIAVELAANPSILFLEEPNSGLDSLGTSEILRILSQLSASKRVIVATLRNPNTRSLSHFHQVLILTRDGRQAYFGPAGLNCNEVLGYFTAIPNVPQYFQMQNPISFVMENLGLGIKRKRSEATDFAEAYKNSFLCESNFKAISSTKKSNSKTALKAIQSKYSATYTRQAGLVMLRTQRFLWRNIQYTYSRLIGCIMIGFLMGSLYFQIEYKDTYGVTSRSLYIYMQIILIGVISANNVIPQIGTDRSFYFREKRSKMYLPIFYPISWVVGEIPYFLIATLAFVGIGNGMAGIATQSAADFSMYWSTLFLFTLCVTYFGMMVTFLAPAPTLAAFVVSIVTSMWVSASGVVVVFSDVEFYKWMYWTNPFQYVINTLTAISFYCDTTQCESECTCPRLADGYYVWDRLATVRSISEGRVNFDVGILAGMCVLFASLALIFFVSLKHNSPQ